MASTLGEYDFWLFDLDGTLVDVEPSYRSSVIETVGDRLGHGFTEEERTVLWHGFGDRRQHLLERHSIDPERFWKHFHEVEDPIARAEATYLFEDAEMMFASLDRPAGLVTHCQRYLTDPVLDSLDIRDWFESVLCCTEETGWKPDPRPIERTMSAMGLSSGGTTRGVLVGDNQQDVGAAWNVGLDAVHVERHGPRARGACVLGDRRVRGLDELVGRSHEPAMD
ncbi:HAD family hydrolase [Halocatena halophila]|uniref:HAD family hydrolase n=1 Tax=Halocatena halophila TaxID=2814576 RepID=UPI002ED6415B